MAHWFKTLFAATGTKTAVPNAADPSGFISYDTGYGPDYERVLGTDPLAKTIERDKLNQVLYDMTGAIQQYQMHAFPEFITTANNGGTPFAYDVDAIVRYDSGGGFNLYQNTTAANTNLPTGAGWVLKSGGFAAISSPAFINTPTAPTAPNGTNTAQVATTAFAYGVISTSANGYVRLPNGLIIQWGITSTLSSGNATITYPITFPNALFRMLGSQQNGNVTVSISPDTTSGGLVAAYAANTGVQVIVGVSWIAIGY